MKGWSAGDAIGGLGVGSLQADLHVVEARCLQLTYARGRKGEAIGDQVGVAAQAMGVGHQRGQVTPLHWLAAGEMHLQDA